MSGEKGILEFPDAAGLYTPTAGAILYQTGGAWYYRGTDGVDRPLAGGIPGTRQVIAGTGLTGGGALSSDVTLNVTANGDGSIVANAHDIQVGVLASDAQHGVRGGGTLHANVVAAGAAGFMTGADKTKLDGLGPATTTSSGTISAADQVTLNTLSGKNAAGAVKRVFRPGDYAAGNTYDPTGAANSTTSFAAAVAAMVAFNDRSTFEIPAGVFQVATGTLDFSTITAPIAILGKDRGASVLIPVGATGDMIKLASGVDGCSVQDFAIFQTGTPQTAGAAIHTNGADDVLISNMLFTNMFQDIFVDNTSIKVEITHTVHSQTNGSATSVGILVTNGAAGDTYIGPDVVMSNTGATRRRACVEIVQSGHAELNQCNLTGSVQALLVDPGAGQIVADLFINTTLFDSCTANGATFNAATATSTIKSVHSVNSWYAGTIAGTGGAGLQFSGVAGGILNGFTSIGDRFLNNQTHGIQIGFGSGFQFIGAAIRGNSQSGAAAADGINISANLGTIKISAGKSGGTDGAETGGNQRYGVNIAAGTGTDIYVGGGIDLSGNQTGPLLNGATGRAIIGECLGSTVPLPPALVQQSLVGVAATQVAVTSSAMDVPAGALQVGETWRCTIDFSTTTLIANTSTWAVKYGATGTAADANLLLQAVAFSGAAIACTGARAIIEFTVRTLGAAATCVGSVQLTAAPTTAMKAAGADCQKMTPSTFNTVTAAKLSISVALSATTTTLLIDRVIWEKVRG